MEECDSGHVVRVLGLRGIRDSVRRRPVRVVLQRLGPVTSVRRVVLKGRCPHRGTGSNVFRGRRRCNDGDARSNGRIREQLVGRCKGSSGSNGAQGGRLGSLCRAFRQAVLWLLLIRRRVACQIWRNVSQGRRDSGRVGPDSFFASDGPDEAVIRHGQRRDKCGGQQGSHERFPRNVMFCRQAWGASVFVFRRLPYRAREWVVGGDSCDGDGGRGRSRRGGLVRFVRPVTQSTCP